MPELLDINTENLNNRLDKEETDSIVAIPDMFFGNVYQSQKNYEFYTVSKAGYALRLDRFQNIWMKEKGMQFVWMMDHKWKKVLEEVSK